ncbi:hypothetical protein ABEB36_012423 [Hypothenemus hampei]|uniref:ZP domain-containing protein n=1 Tax=Hypothenemus hampei TaxID=57062 RepID=A0ABD1EBA4_HYPHA
MDTGKATPKVPPIFRFLAITCDPDELEPVCIVGHVEPSGSVLNFESVSSTACQVSLSNSTRELSMEFHYENYQRDYPASTCQTDIVC